LFIQPLYFLANFFFVLVVWLIVVAIGVQNAVLAAATSAFIDHTVGAEFGCIIISIIIKLPLVFWIWIEPAK
jgi:hypothetical protein